MPLSEDAQQKYPARLNFKGTIRVGSHYFNDVSVNPMDYAYRHQLKLVMSIDEAVKLLGNKQDGSQLFLLSASYGERGSGYAVPEKQTAG